MILSLSRPMAMLIGLCIALSAMIIHAPVSAQTAEADAWARVIDCDSLAAFRRQHGNPRYVVNSAIARRCPERRVNSESSPNPDPPPITCDTRWTDATRRNTASAYESFAERCSSHRNWSEAHDRARRLRMPPPPPVQTAEQLESQGWAARNRNDFVSARALFRRACYANNPSPLACNNYAFELTSDRSGRVDYPEARLNYARSCNLLADAQRCDNAWITAISTTYGPAQPATEVMELHRKSGRGASVDCNGWRAELCGKLATMYEATGRSVDYAMARQLFGAACLGFAGYCRNAALANAMDNFGVPDFVAVRNFFDRIPSSDSIDCASYAFPCFAMAYGSAYPVLFGNTSRNGPYDFQLAERFARASCTAGEKRGCNLLGRLAYDRRITSVRPVDAFNYFGEACSARLADGCNNRGLAYEAGYGAATDRTLATINYLDGCNSISAPDWSGGPSSGRAQACYNLARSHLDGIYVSRSASEARRYFDIACRLGHALACASLNR